MKKDRNDWTPYATRLLKEDSIQLMKYSQILKETGKIQKADRYSITRFALKSLLMTLNKKTNSKKTTIIR